VGEVKHLNWLIGKTEKKAAVLLLLGIRCLVVTSSLTLFSLHLSAHTPFPAAVISG